MKYGLCALPPQLRSLKKSEEGKKEGETILFQVRMAPRMPKPSRASSRL